MGVYYFHEFTPTFQLFAQHVGIALHIYIHTSHAFMVTLMHSTHTYTYTFIPCVNVPMQIGIHTYIQSMIVTMVYTTHTYIHIDILTQVYTTHVYIYAYSTIPTMVHTSCVHISIHILIHACIQYVIYCHGTAKVYFSGAYFQTGNHNYHPTNRPKYLQ